MNNAAYLVENQKSQDDDARRLFEEVNADPNNFKFWASALNPLFKSPASYEVPLTLEWFTWLISDSYTDEMIVKFGQYLIDKLRKSLLFQKSPLFLKGQTFSNKYTFSNCVIQDPNNALDVGSKALNIFYTGLCGDRIESGFVFREFIDPNNALEAIYDGMPLHTEFRVFYNFDTHRIIRVFPYWDAETMKEALAKRAPNDYDSFVSAVPRLEKDFIQNQQRVQKCVEDTLQNHEMKVPYTGFANIWSLDFMLSLSGDIWFIDAAVGSQSYYWAQLSQSEKQ